MLKFYRNNYDILVNECQIGSELKFVICNSALFQPILTYKSTCRMASFQPVKLFTENLTHILTCTNLTISVSFFIQETKKTLESIIPSHLNLQFQNLFLQLKNLT